MSPTPVTTCSTSSNVCLWLTLTLRHRLFWAFLTAAFAAIAALSLDSVLSTYSETIYVVSWLIPSTVLCWLQASLLKAASQLGGTPRYWTFLTATLAVGLGLLLLLTPLATAFPPYWIDAMRWWGMVLTASCLHLSALFRSLLLVAMAWFGSTCATYSPLGVWIDIWPRPDRPLMVSIFLAAGWLVLGACLAMRGAPHEVRHSR